MRKNKHALWLIQLIFRQHLKMQSLSFSYTSVLSSSFDACWRNQSDRQQKTKRNKTRLLPDQVKPVLTPGGLDQKFLLLTYKWHKEFCVTGVSKTITQNDKNTPKPADNPWLDQSRSIGTTGEKFWMCSSCGIGKRDTYALCLQDCHSLRSVPLSLSRSW